MTNNWCEKDRHNEFLLFSDFNDWLDSTEGELIRDKYQLNGSFSNPSKAFFAGDRQGYNQALAEYRNFKVDEALSRTFLCSIFYSSIAFAFLLVPSFRAFSFGTYFRFLESFY